MDEEDDGLTQYSYYLGSTAPLKNTYINNTNIEDLLKGKNDYIESLFALLSILYRNQYANKYLIICLQNRKLYIGKFIEIRPALDLSDYSSCLFIGSEFEERVDCRDIKSINIIDFNDRESAILYAELAD